MAKKIYTQKIEKNRLEQFCTRARIPRRELFIGYF